MSQEINLLNPALRRKADWLGFERVALAAGLCLALLVAAYVAVTLQARAASAKDVEAKGLLQTVQQELLVVQTQLAARKNDPALELEAKRLELAVQQRQALLQLVSTSAEMKGAAATGGNGVAEVMRGFARQIVDGVWLTGFVVGKDNFEMRGRLLSASLLPAYIRRLNAEPAFRGRHFEALEMRAVSEDADKPGDKSGAPDAAAKARRDGPADGVPRYVEFALRGTLDAPPAAAATAGGAR